MKEFLIAIISAFVGGLVTFIFTLISDKRKEKREDKKESRKIKEETYKTRPEMTIVDYKNYLSREGYGVKQECDLAVFITSIDDISFEGEKKNKVVLAHFDKKKFNQNEWCCVIYAFKNVGETAISQFDLICNFQRTLCLFPVNGALEFASNNCLNYSRIYDKKIRPTDIVRVKVCYHKDHIQPSVFSANISLGMIDDNGRHWMQPLFAPEEKIYDSRAVSAKEYNDAVRTEIAEECFKKPGLW